MRAWRLLAAAALLALAGCAPTATPGAAATPTDAAVPPTGAAPPVPALAPEPAPTAEIPQAPAHTASASPSPAVPSLACDSDADCAVKDVGSCCGYRPACVNVDAQTFPDQVKARCAADGRMGICGFAPVSGCQCVEGQCAARTEAIGPAPPKALQ